MNGSFCSREWKLSLYESLALGEQRMQGRLRSSSGVQFILIQTCEKWILYFVSLFLLFIGENRLGPESSLSCPTWRAWGVPQEQGLPLLPPLCHPQLLFHTTQLPLLPFLAGKENCWRLLKGHWTFFPCAWRTGEKHWTGFSCPSPREWEGDEDPHSSVLQVKVELGSTACASACWWSQCTVLRGDFPRYPCRECWGHGEHSYLSHWGMVLAPVPAENQWSSAAQEPASMCQVGMQGTQPPS